MMSGKEWGKTGLQFWREPRHMSWGNTDKDINFFLYLVVNPTGVHPSGVGLDGDDSLSHSQIGPSISHHSILFLTYDGRFSLTQVFSISENKQTKKNKWWWQWRSKHLRIKTHMGGTWKHIQLLAYNYKSIANSVNTWPVIQLNMRQMHRMHRIHSTHANAQILKKEVKIAPQKNNVNTQELVFDEHIKPEAVVYQRGMG